MNETTPTEGTPRGVPNPDLLRSQGWHIRSSHGKYCVAWNAHGEAVFAWIGNGWEQVNGRPARAA